jgi:hypothetical protein
MVAVALTAKEYAPDRPLRPTFAQTWSVSVAADPQGSGASQGKATNDV